MSDRPLQPLTYSTEQSVSEIVWEEGDAYSRVTLPAPPVWRVALVHSLGLLVCGSLTLVAGLAALRGGLAPAAVVAFACFLSISGWLIWRLSQVPRLGQVPTVITATPDGLSFSTARRGFYEAWSYPIDQIQAFGIQRGPLSAGLSTSTRIVLRLNGLARRTDGQEVILELWHRVDALKLETFLRRQLGNAMPHATITNFASARVRII